MRLASGAFGHDEAIQKKYTCGKFVEGLQYMRNECL
jgi:hypothetical protein